MATYTIGTVFSFIFLSTYADDSLSRTLVPQCALVSITMSDDWGDGWDGVVLHVGQQTVTLAAGSSGTEVLCLTPGTYTPYACGDGLWMEVSWTVGSISGSACPSCEQCPQEDAESLLICESGTFIDFSRRRLGFFSYFHGIDDKISLRDDDLTYATEDNWYNYDDENGVFSYQYSDMICSICPSGTYSSTGESSCTSCPPGQHSPEGASECTQNSFTGCPPGKYLGSNGQALVCLSCSAGMYASVQGSSSCVMCAAGRSQPNTGSAFCFHCTPGRFSLESGASSCQHCAMGLYQPNTGSSSCLSCPAGTFSSGKAATSSAICENCMPGFYSALPASSTCEACGPETISDSGASYCDSKENSRGIETIHPTVYPTLRQISSSSVFANNRTISSGAIAGMTLAILSSLIAVYCFVSYLRVKNAPTTKLNSEVQLTTSLQVFSSEEKKRLKRKEEFNRLLIQADVAEYEDKLQASGFSFVDDLQEASDADLEALSFKPTMIKRIRRYLEARLFDRTDSKFNALAEHDLIADEKHTTTGILTSDSRDP